MPHAALRVALSRYVLNRRGGRGLNAAVHPCAGDRRPTAGVVRFGPLVTEADAEAVGVWQRAGKPDGGTLSGRSRAPPAPWQVAPSTGAVGLRTPHGRGDLGSRPKPSRCSSNWGRRRAAGDVAMSWGRGRRFRRIADRRPVSG